MNITRCLQEQFLNLQLNLKKKQEQTLSLLTFPGGVGIPYRPDQEPNDIMAIGEGVRKVYEEILKPEGMDDIAIYTEMGRFMMGPYGALVTKAVHEKHIYKEYIGVDACAVKLNETCNVWCISPYLQ